MNHFSLTSPAHNARRFLDTSCQSRDRVPLITGFSSIRTWVTQPCHKLRRLGNKRFCQASGETHRLFRPYKGTKIYFLHPCLLPSRLPIPAHSSSSAQARVLLLKPLQACPEQEASGWSPPSRRRTSKSYGVIALELLVVSCICETPCIMFKFNLN